MSDASEQTWNLHEKPYHCSMTVRELAKILKLGKSTVADALQGRPWVEAETRERILSKARELGYRRNPMASAFLQQIRSGGSSRYRANIALIYPQHGGPASKIGIQQRTLFQGVCERAEELGYSIDRINLEEYDANRLTRVLLARGILGIITGPMVRFFGHLTLDWSKFAAISFGYSITRPSLHRVVHDHLEGVRTAFRQCQKKGFRRIGMVIRKREGDMRSNGLWSSGFWNLQQRLAKKDQVQPFLAEDLEYTPRHIQKWLGKEKPEAVIFHTQERIPLIPEIFDGTSGSVWPVVLDRLPNDSCAGIDQQYHLCGAKLAELLSLQILHNQQGIPIHPTITLINGRWINRASDEAQQT